MNPKRITRWAASASLTADLCTITFEFEGGSHTNESLPIPSARLAAVIAVLESSQGAYLTQKPDGFWYVSNMANSPGIG